MSQTIPHPDDLLTALIATEQHNPRTEQIDTLDTLAMLQLMNAEDAHVIAAVNQALPSIVPLIEAVAKAFQTGGRLIYVGAGTSGRLGVLDASECPPTFGVPASWVVGVIAGGEKALTQAIENAEDNTLNGYQVIKCLPATPQDVVIGLSASGGAPFVLSALETARDLGATTGCITCVANTALATVVQYPVVVETGAEVIAGSTRLKAGTAQKLVLNMISTLAMVKIGKTYGNLMVDVKPTNAKLQQRAVRLVSILGQCSPEEAGLFLQQGRNNVKLSILIAHHPSWSPREAEAFLSQHDGKLKLALQALQVTVHED
jgi:N-acetylmuramic acid 6-phosphate etherase